MNSDAGGDQGGAGGDQGGATESRRGRDPEVAFPLAIVSVAFGTVGLTVPTLAWVAAGLAVVAYVLNTPHAPTRVLGIIGSTLGVVGIAAAFIG